jgi:anti-sigma B factor antagonist
MPEIHKTHIEPDIELVAISGRITLGPECQAIEQTVDELISANQKKVVFDLSGVEYLDSTGIGILVMCCGRMQAAGGELRVASIQPKVAELVRIAKLDQMMVFYPTVAAAFENFNTTV